MVGADPGLPTRTIGGLELTLLSPTLDTLAELRNEWPVAVRSAGLDPERPPAGADVLGSVVEDYGVDLRTLLDRVREPADSSVANRSSIAFLATYDGQTVLFGADAHADVLAESLARLPLPVDLAACKVPHHGSRQNVKPDLLDKLQCSTWLISTDGSRHHHPDRRAMARLLGEPGTQTLVFNYEKDSTKEYGDDKTRNEFGHRVCYRGNSALGIRVQLSPDVSIADVLST